MSSYSTPGVYVEESPRYPVPVARADTGLTAFVGQAAQGPLDTPVRVQDFAQFESTFGPLDADLDLPWALWQYFLNGGTDAWVVRVADTTAPSLVGDRAARRGLFALETTGGFGLLCLPGLADAAVLRAAADYCEERHAFLILDVPATAQTAAQALQTLPSAHGPLPASSNAAAYYPWVMVTDPRGGAPRRSPPSGTLAGVYARTDRTRGVWKAPAGTQAQLQGVEQLADTLPKIELDDLNQGGICCLRGLPSGEFCAWGARTLRPTDPGWKYIAVRRLALLVQRSLLTGLEWVVFEPNDEALWANLRATATNFLHDLWRDGALQGSQAKHGYFAQCSLGQTMTLDDIAHARARLTIGIAPLRPAEFVVLKLELPTAG